MLRGLVTAVVIAFTVPAALATPWKLRGSCTTPGENPRGYYAMDGERGYIVQDGPSPYVYYVYWYVGGAGSIFSSFPAPGGPGAWGICYSSHIGDFYLSNNRTSWLYEITDTGSVLASFVCPIPGPGDMEQHWAAPCDLYIAIPDRNVIAVVDRTTGSLVSSFAAPGSRPTACGGYSAFFVTDSDTDAVYEDGSPVITGIDEPTGFDYAAYAGRGIWEYALFVVDDATDRIYFYDNAEGVAPASFGKVKALFR